MESAIGAEKEQHISWFNLSFVVGYRPRGRSAGRRFKDEATAQGIN
jgi:hypothetical protein